MNTTDKPSKERFVLHKRAQTFRFTEQNVEMLEQFARAYGMSKTAYVEMALRERMERDAARL